MKPVDQTKFGDEGNCFGACMASLLELSLEEVLSDEPARSRHGGQCLSPKQSELLAARGLTYVEVPRGNLTTSAQDDPPRETQVLGWQPLLYGESRPLCILCGPSPRCVGIKHAVVGRTNGYVYDVVHDPHPDRTGLTDVDAIGFFVRLDPAS